MTTDATTPNGDVEDLPLPVAEPEVPIEEADDDKDYEDTDFDDDDDDEDDVVIEETPDTADIEEELRLSN